MNERELFLSALEIDDPAERQAHLRERCQHDQELLARVERLLSSHDSQSRFLNTPVAEQLAKGKEPQPHTAIREGAVETADREADLASSASEEAAQTIGIHDELIDESLSAYLDSSEKPGSIGRLGHYDVLEVLGRGAFGTVLKAFDDKLQRVVAIKVLSPEIAVTSPARKRFLREARSSAAVRHENVVAIYAVDESPIPYLVMEYIPGQTLQQRLDEHGPLELLDVLRLGEQIAWGLAAAHRQQLIHRDVKPGNILLETSIEDRVKITDFGLARAVDDASMTQSGVIAGTPLYMAPEQALGQKLDQRADLFSLGSVLYQMLTGRPPFRASSTLAVLKRVTEDTPRPIQEITPEVPDWMCGVVARLHQKSPDERYESAREVAELLGHCRRKLEQARVPDLTTPTVTLKRPERRMKARSSWWAGHRMTALIGLTLFVLTGAAVAFILSGNQSGNLIVEVTDPNISVQTDTQSVTLRRSSINEGARDSFNVRTDHAGGDQQQITIHRDGQAAVILNANDILTDIADSPVLSEDWTSLFNGNDLKGWESHPDESGNWRVEGGVMTASGKPGYLFTTRDDFADFHLQCELRINAGGDSGVIVRTGFEKPTQYGLPGYEAQILGGPPAVKGWQTGAIAGSDATRGWRLLQPSDLMIPPDTWVTLDIIAIRNRIETRIGGTTVAAHDEQEQRFIRGRLALQQSTPATRVQFRNIQVRLPVTSDKAISVPLTETGDGNASS